MPGLNMSAELELVFFSPAGKLTVLTEQIDAALHEGIINRYLCKNMMYSSYL